VVLDLQENSRAHLNSQMNLNNSTENLNIEGK